MFLIVQLHRSIFVVPVRLGRLLRHACFLIDHLS